MIAPRISTTGTKRNTLPNPKPANRIYILRKWPPSAFGLRICELSVRTVCWRATMRSLPASSRSISGVHTRESTHLFAIVAYQQINAAGHADNSAVRLRNRPSHKRATTVAGRRPGGANVNAACRSARVARHRACLYISRIFCYHFGKGCVSVKNLLQDIRFALRTFVKIRALR